MDALDEELPVVALSLAGDTPTASRADWDKAAAAVLRKAGRMSAEDGDTLALERLSSRMPDTLVVPALGTAETVLGTADPGLPGRAPFTRGSVTAHTDGWDIRAQIAEPDAVKANQAALLDLERGAVSLWLTVGDSGSAVADLGRVLDGVFLNFGPVVLNPDATVDPVAVATAFENVLQERGLTSAATSNLGADPIGAVGRFGGSPEVTATVVEVARVAQRLGVRGLVVDATVVHDAGATDAQELGYSLAVGLAYLRILEDAGFDLDDAAALIEFRYAATDAQFPTIAKLRAARTLWHRVTQLCGIAQSARGQIQHAVTSKPMMTRYDPWVNMLRTTVASFAAGVGGANAVSVLPFDDAIGKPDTLARRIARNTSSLLISESHLGKVTDPAGGSYAVEQMTQNSAELGWAQFQLIEAAGGVLAVLADGTLAARVADAATARDLLIAKRRQPITGVSEFPHSGERLPVREPRTNVNPTGTLAFRAYAEPFETLRDTPPSASVFLATLGTVAQHTARATFAGNLFAAGGVSTVVAGGTTGTADVVAKFRESGCMVACVAGTDGAYAATGAEVVAALREAGAKWVILTGKPPADIETDDFLSVGADALAFLHRTRDQLQENS